MIIIPGLFFQADVGAWGSEPQQERLGECMGIQILEAQCSDDCSRANLLPGAVVLLRLIECFRFEEVFKVV